MRYYPLNVKMKTNAEQEPAKHKSVIHAQLYTYTFFYNNNTFKCMLIKI